MNSLSDVINKLETQDKKIARDLRNSQEKLLKQHESDLKEVYKANLLHTKRLIKIQSLLTIILLAMMVFGLTFIAAEIQIRRLKTASQELQIIQEEIKTKNTWSLQEVTGKNVKKAKILANWPEDPHYEFLADSNWKHYVYGRNVVYPSGHHGNAILSKYHISESERVDISTSRIEKRGFLYCRIETGLSPHPVHCICVHLSLSSRSRNKQFIMLEKYIKNKIPYHEPLVIAGDFNEWRKNPGGRNPHNLGMKDAIMETKGKMARTFPSWLPILPLDRIWLRGLTAMKSKIYHTDVWARLSDHAALFTEAEIDR